MGLLSPKSPKSPTLPQSPPDAAPPPEPPPPPPTPPPLAVRHRRPVLTPSGVKALLASLEEAGVSGLSTIETEYRIYIEKKDKSTVLEGEEAQVLDWLLRETFDEAGYGEHSFLVNKKDDFDKQGANTVLVEVGPRMSFTTAWSTNAVTVCHACGLSEIVRMERSRNYLVVFESESAASAFDKDAFLALVHDRMTECEYSVPLRRFTAAVTAEPVRTVPILEKGRAALADLNKELGLGMDDWDLDYYTAMFKDDMKRNPTDVECFDLAQSNSEHSRHWFFRGKLVIDGEEVPNSLMKIVKKPLASSNNNSIIAMSDNCSAIRGYECEVLTPSSATSHSKFTTKNSLRHIQFTAETHNFPTGVAPFPGAETGTGGRIRDSHATGRGSIPIAGTAAYCVGNLNIPGYELPWESKDFQYPTNLASPLRIVIDASNGASDYGNKFGEPIIQGYVRSFGMRLPDSERYEYVKPIMFTGGLGQVDDKHTKKGAPELGMLVVKVGGPAYRIGMGGGAASSMVQGDNKADLDFNAVQRGDAEMEQKLNRVIRSCVEMASENPIISIHDQGAGGNCNVVKEIVDPAGGRIEIRDVVCGDKSMSVLELWGAEYQEQSALLLRPNHRGLFQSMCDRECVPVAFIGEVTNDGRIVVHDRETGTTPVDLDLSKVLGDLPDKTFKSNRASRELAPLALPSDLSIRGALDRVLRLMTVGSKRFLTNKVDRAVTALIAQQQCVGPLHTPLANVAVTALSYFGVEGSATAIGEQPIKGLVSPAAMGRMTVGESLTNLVWARVSALRDVKCSGNWMWAAKLPHEGAALYDACVAMSDVMVQLGVAIDGGKDSLSMAAKVPPAPGKKSKKGAAGETVKAPGTLVVSSYCACPDVTKTVTPDIKAPGSSVLLLVDLGQGRARMGGSALAQCYDQLGNESPDMDDPDMFARAFNTLQELIEKGQILAGHDRSDGGLITTLLEMAFAGDCGVGVNITSASEVSSIDLFFAEELGLVLEVATYSEESVLAAFKSNNVPCAKIGLTTRERDIVATHNGNRCLDEKMVTLRDVWEETSFQIERRQANPDCVDQEQRGLKGRSAPPFQLSFEPAATPLGLMHIKSKPAVAILRAEGSNSDREMAAAFHMAGFDAFDVSLQDLLNGSANLSPFRGLAFVGGFSYADVLDSAKGWAGAIRFHPSVFAQFQDFYHRPNTFSLGVCNGCQLMALLGWVPYQGIEMNKQPRFIHNDSGRYESRFTTVKIVASDAVLLRGMEGSTLGVWIQHGEGKAYFPSEQVLETVVSDRLAPIVYVDDDNKPTQVYPHNPNGSQRAIAALCSPDGRHLAMMPHPERTFLPFNWPWKPQDWNGLTTSPWMRLFQNARAWCHEMDEGTGDSGCLTEGINCTSNEMGGCSTQKCIVS